MAFFFPLGCTELTSFVPFVLMLMMHMFGPFRERERTGESNRRVEKEEREFHGLFFNLWIVLFPLGIHPY